MFTDLSATVIISRKFKLLRQDLKRWSKSLSYIKRLTLECSKVILHFDHLEELRPLTTPEFNFRKIVKLHHEELLRIHYIYWKQRCTIRYIKVGEENSKFFHAMASERMWRNSIASLKVDDGTPVSDHPKWRKFYALLSKIEWARPKELRWVLICSISFSPSQDLTIYPGLFLLKRFREF